MKLKRSLQMMRYFVIIFAVLFPIGLLHAETIVLKNGAVFSAKVVNQNQRTITVQLANGQMMVYNKSDVKKISYKSVNEVKQEIAEKTAVEVKKIEPVPPVEKKPVEPNLPPESVAVTPWGAMGYSAILPGRGLTLQDRYWSAWTYRTLMLLSAGAYLYSKNKYDTGLKAAEEQAGQSRIMTVFLNAQIGVQPTGLAVSLLSSSEQQVKSQYDESEGKNALSNMSTASAAFGVFYLVQIIHSGIAAKFFNHNSSNEALGTGFHMSMDIVTSGRVNEYRPNHEVSLNYRIAF